MKWLFSQETRDSTGRNYLKLHQGMFRLDIWKNTITKKVFRPWNRLSWNVVESPYVEVFKRCAWCISWCISTWCISSPESVEMEYVDSWNARVPGGGPLIGQKFLKPWKLWGSEQLGKVMTDGTDWFQGRKKSKISGIVSSDWTQGMDYLKLSHMKRVYSWEESWNHLFIVMCLVWLWFCLKDSETATDRETKRVCGEIKTWFVWVNIFC